MTEFLNILKTCIEFFVSFGIIIVFTLIFFPIVLKGVQKNIRKRIVLASIICLCLCLIISALVFVIYVLCTKYSYSNLNLYLLFTLVLSVNINLALAVNIRRELSKAKKSTELGESVRKSVGENSKKMIDVIVYFFIFLLALFLLVSKEIGLFIITLAFPCVICFFLFTFFYQHMCKISERFIK
jgi:hypothetical protein